MTQSGLTFEKLSDYLNEKNRTQFNTLFIKLVEEVGQILSFMKDRKQFNFVFLQATESFSLKNSLSTLIWKINFLLAVKDIIEVETPIARITPLTTSEKVVTIADLNKLALFVNYRTTFQWYSFLLTKFIFFSGALWAPQSNRPAVESADWFLPKTFGGPSASAVDQKQGRNAQQRR